MVKAETFVRNLSLRTKIILSVYNSVSYHYCDHQFKTKLLVTKLARMYKSGLLIVLASGTFLFFKVKVVSFILVT